MTRRPMVEYRLELLLRRRLDLDTRIVAATNGLHSAQRDLWAIHGPRSHDSTRGVVTFLVLGCSGTSVGSGALVQYQEDDGSGVFNDANPYEEVTTGASGTATVRDIATGLTYTLRAYGPGGSASGLVKLLTFDADSGELEIALAADSGYVCWPGCNTRGIKTLFTVDDAFGSGRSTNSINAAGSGTTRSGPPTCGTGTGTFQYFYQMGYAGRTLTLTCEQCGSFTDYPAPGASLVPSDPFKISSTVSLGSSPCAPWGLTADFGGTTVGDMVFTNQGQSGIVTIHEAP